MNTKLLGPAFLIALSGCATTPTVGYDWSGYDTSLYRFYKDPTTAEEFRTSLQAHLNDLESRNVPPPPGLYAEIGTLYLER